MKTLAPTRRNLPGAHENSGTYPAHLPGGQRWLLHISATALLHTKSDTALKRWGTAPAARIGRKKAKSAIARKLVTVLWAMWRRRTPFESRLPISQPAVKAA